MNQEEVLLEVEGLSKSFMLKSPEGKVQPFKALDEVTFSMGRAQVIGLIGENGSGKSTLLRILSRMLKPDSGQVRFYGRAASVLEIGSGFHQDLTGAENVKMVGGLLGVPASGSQRLLEEVTQFSELDRFIHEPVKHYSSGMFLRLAFSVAMLSDADLLFLDEVIGVGDESFSRKTVRRIKALSQAGKSILMATHSSGLLSQLCTHALLLQQGKMVAFGDAANVLQHYTATVLEKESRILSPAPTDAGGISQKWFNACEGAMYHQAGLSVLSGKLISDAKVLSMDSAFDVCFELKLKQKLPLTISLQFNYQLNFSAMCFSPGYNPEHLKVTPEDPGIYQFHLKIPAGVLNCGLYSIHLIAVDENHQTLIQLEHFLVFEILLGTGASERAGYRGHFNGPVFMELPWNCIKIGDA